MYLRNNNCFLFQRLFQMSAGFIILFQSAFGQANDFLKLRYDTTISLKVQSLDNRIYASFTDSVITYTSDDDIDTANRSIKFYAYNIVTKDTLTAEIKLMCLNGLGYLNQMLLTKNYLTFLFDDRILVYERHGLKFKFQKIILRRDQFNCIALLQNEKFLFYSIYNYHPESCKYKTNFLIYDPVEETATNVFHPELNSIAFSHLPNSWVATTGDEIAVANPGKYCIKFYDAKFKLTDSILYQDEAWKSFENYEFPFNTNPEVVNPKITVDSIFNCEKYISRIEQIYFRDKANLLVISKMPFQENTRRRIDLWTRSKKKWILNSTIMDYACIEMRSDTMDFNNARIDFYSDLPVHFFNNNTILKICDDNFTRKEGVTFGEFSIMKNDFYKKNEPRYAIEIFTIKR
jgi:hypothetical protein